MRCWPALGFFCLAWLGNTEEEVTSQMCTGNADKKKIQRTILGFARARLESHPEVVCAEDRDG